MINILKQLFGAKDNTELKTAIDEGALLVDVREPFEVKMGGIKGAVNIPLNQIATQMSKLKNKKKIVVFCQSGGRSAQAKRILDQNGIPNVINGGSWTNVKKVVEEKA